MRAIRIFGRNIRDAFKSVFRNFSLSLASIACIIITLCVVSIAIILSYNVNNFTVRVEQDMTIVVFLNRDIEDERIKEIEDEIKVLNNVESVTFNDKMQIAEEMKESSEDLAGFLEQYEDRDSNPLSDAFHVKVTDVLTIEDVALEIEKIDGVMSVKYGEGMIEPLISTFDFVKNISYGVVIALVLVTAFLISNTIKITIFSRKREIEIMRLVGASNINIKIPFIFEGLFLGIIGSILPIAITIIGYNTLYTKFNGQVISPLIQLVEPLPFTYFVSLVLLTIGILVGMYGSWRAVRKYLKI
ncbi:MAG TPA: ABC transporter permease [Candidatus Faecisoma merdavium]|nr:ABC transporter permease [Candidatus Faecisoma merdavium]